MEGYRTRGQGDYRQVPNGAPPGHYLGQLIKNGGIGLFYLKETYFPQLIKNVQIVPRGGTIWHLTVPLSCTHTISEVAYIFRSI